MHTNIFIFGDSVAFGKYDPEGGWAQRFSNYLMGEYLADKTGGYEYYIFNLSVSSSHSQSVIPRVNSEVTARLSETGAKNVAVFAIGLNDAAYVHSKKGYWVDFAEFKINIQKLIESAKQTCKTILFAGLYPIDESMMDPMPYDLDKSYRNRDIEKYDKAMQEIAQANNSGYIPLYDKFMAADYKKLLHDGAHPNSAGHQLIFETVRDYLLANEII